MVLLSRVVPTGGPGLRSPSHGRSPPTMDGTAGRGSAEPSSFGDGDAHLPGGPGDDLLGAVEVERVQVGELCLRDLPDLVTRERPGLDRVRRRAPLVQARGLEDEPGGRRGLRDEGEGAVFVDRDLHRHDVAALALRRGVVLLDELHDVDAVLTQGRTYRRGRGRGAGLDLQLDHGRELFLRGHVPRTPISVLPVRYRRLGPPARGVRSWRPG